MTRWYRTLAHPAGTGGPSGVGMTGALMKVRASVKPMCEKCKVIKRRGVLRIVCENPKHKQRQG